MQSEPVNSKLIQVSGFVAFIVVLLDMMMTYFLRPILGLKEVPVNGMLPIIVFALAVRWGIDRVCPPFSVLYALGMGFGGFLVGIFGLPDFGPYRVFSVISGFSAFFIGYFASRWSYNEELYARAFIFVGGLYTVVCVVAVLEVFPDLFPIIKAYGYRDGILITRPEVTTDQNFQIFYLFPIVLGLCLPFRTLRFLMVFAGLIGAFYVLNILQSRSGFLLLIGATFLSLLVPHLTKDLGRMKTIILPFFLAALLLLNFDFILRVATPIIGRFIHHNYNTYHGRVMSFTYLLEHLFEPTYWIPQGYAEFKRMTGGHIPHSNPTAMFIEGGILGLYMWIIVFLVPLTRLLVGLIRRELDPLATIILIGGVVAFVAQMSLNAPLYEQVYLWAGAVVGTLYRSKELVEYSQTETGN